MRILHLEASTGWGGQEIRILREAEGMRVRGHEMILGVAKGGALVSRARDAGFPVYELEFKKTGWPLTFYRLLRILKRHRIDLVNTHSSLNAWIGAAAARVAKIPVVRTRHLSTPIKAGMNSRILYGKLADFVVATCSEILPTISAQSGKPLSLCRSIPTGVQPETIRFDPEERERYRSLFGGREAFIVGTACFMRSWKGIDDLLQAADLLRDLPDLRWAIIGGGHEEAYRKRAKELKVDHLVHFTGHLPSPFAAIAALDLFALLSTAHEGVSQAILQAAYLERPLLATRTGGLCEVCLDGVTGLQVAPFSPEQVASGVLRLKGDPELAQRMGRAGRERVEKQFTFQGTLDQMEEVYRLVSIERKGTNR